MIEIVSRLRLQAVHYIDITIFDAIPLPLQLADAKKRSDDDQVDIEELQAAKRKQDKEVEALNDRIEQAKAEAQKALKSKKKVQEEVSTCTTRTCVYTCTISVLCHNRF